MYVVDTLAPLFVVVLLGVILRRSGFASAELFAGINRLVYWVGLPCLLFEKTARSVVQGGAAARISLALVVGMAACVALGYLAGWALRMPRRSVGALVQGAYRGNLAYVGLPVILFSLAGPDGLPQDRIEALAVVAIAPLVPIYNAVAVAVLLAGRPGAAHRGSAGLRVLLVKVATNPLLLACAGGIGWSLAGWPLPVLAERTLVALGRMALPLALLALGGCLVAGSLRSTLAPAMAGAVIKVIAAPVAGYLIGRAIGLGPAEMRITLVYLACPTAVVSFVMAEQLGSDCELAANIVVLATVLCAPVLVAVLLVT